MFVWGIFDLFPALILATLGKITIVFRRCVVREREVSFKHALGHLVVVEVWLLIALCWLLEAAAGPVQHGIHLAGHGHLRWEWNALFLSEILSRPAQRGDFSNRCLNRLLALLSLSVACVQMTEFQRKDVLLNGFEFRWVWMAYAYNCIVVAPLL